MLNRTPIGTPPTSSILKRAVKHSDRRADPTLRWTSMLSPCPRASACHQRLVGGCRLPDARDEARTVRNGVS